MGDPEECLLQTMMASVDALTAGRMVSAFALARARIRKKNAYLLPAYTRPYRRGLFEERLGTLFCLYIS